MSQDERLTHQTPSLILRVKQRTLQNCFCRDAIGGIVFLRYSSVNLFIWIKILGPSAVVGPDGLMSCFPVRRCAYLDLGPDSFSRERIKELSKTVLSPLQAGPPG